MITNIHTSKEKKGYINFSNETLTNLKKDIIIIDLMYILVILLGYS